jgi:hypothetical protein
MNFDYGIVMLLHTDDYPLIRVFGNEEKYFCANESAEKVTKLI